MDIMKIQTHPLGGYMLTSEFGAVMLSATTVPALKLQMRLAMERGEISPFVMLYDEYGNKVQYKEYVREI